MRLTQTVRTCCVAITYFRGPTGTTRNPSREPWVHGTVQSLVHGIRVELSETHPELRGLRGAGLLYAQCTYTVSLGGGQPGTQVVRLERALLVYAGQHQRFKLKCTDAGFAWREFLRLTLLYGQAGEGTPVTVDIL
jgi:hypothetical protein